MMEEATYSFGGAAKILDIAESKLRYWAQVGFVGPSGRRGGKPRRAGVPGIHPRSAP
jgi:hypothetical protein